MGEKAAHRFSIYPPYQRGSVNVVAKNEAQIMGTGFITKNVPYLSEGEEGAKKGAKS